MKKICFGVIVITAAILVYSLSELYAFQNASRLDIAEIQKAINAANAKWVAGENAITRLSPEERQMRLIINDHHLTRSEAQSVSSPDIYLTLPLLKIPLSLPLSLDWRNNGGNWITPIRDQGNGPYCGAFTVTAAVESATLRANNAPGVNLDLSEQVLISCTGGATEDSLDYVRKYGLPLESCYPYTASKGDCSNLCSSWQSAVYKISQWNRVSEDPATNVDILKAALLYGPVMVDMAIYTDFYSYNGGIYSYVNGVFEGSHVVLLIGYNDANEYFIAKNSWGTNWGEGGFFRIAYSQVSGLGQVMFGGYPTLLAVEPFCETTIGVNGPGSYDGIQEQNFSADSQTKTVFVNASSNDCVWTAQSNVPWIQISSNTSGIGSGQVSFTLEPNISPASRTGTIMIANYTLTVNQKGTAPDPYVFVAELGPNLPNNDQLGVFILGVAVDSGGFIYGSDNANNRVVKFDPYGNFVTSWGSSGFGYGQFSYPQGIAVDSSGYIYVVDSGGSSHYRIQKFDNQGNFIKAIGGVENDNIWSLAVDQNGYIYTPDSCNNNILKFDSSGSLVAKWGVKGSGNGQFSSPRAIAVDLSGHLYVYDSGNYRIQTFDSDGRFLFEWGSYGLGDGQFMGFDNYIAVDNSGYVYVTDHVKYNIQKFSNHGNFITKWGSRGIGGNGQLGNPGGIAVDLLAGVYVGDFKRILRFMPVSLETVSTPTSPSGAANGTINISYSYTTGGSTSSLGNTVEYQFDWKGDESDLSSWGSSTQSKIWMSAGTYNVRARARDAVGTSVRSGWSSGLSVTISAETVSTPSTPSGPATGTSGKSCAYSTGGSISNLGHSVEYQFDWKGDGSDLSAWSSSTQSKTWSTAGVYNVRVRARCTQDISVLSDWSSPLSISISIPDISITPKAYDFGSVKVKRSKTASFIVKNNGTVNLSINSGITDEDASMFKIAINGGSKTIKPGKTLTIKVAFKPTSTGATSSALKVTSNDPDTAMIDIPLSGTGQ